MKWINENQIEGEKNVEEFVEEINKENKELLTLGHKGKHEHPIDHVATYKETFEYRGIKYVVEICRDIRIDHFTWQVLMYEEGIPMVSKDCINKFGKRVFLRCHPETQQVSEIMGSLPEQFSDDRFLRWMICKDRTVKEMVNDIHSVAEQDIDDLYNIIKKESREGYISFPIDKGTQAKVEKLRSLVRGGK